MPSPATYQIFYNAKQKTKPFGNCWFPERFFFKWKKFLKGDRSSIADEQPWITFLAIDFLERKLNKNMKVFEFGGGGSTIFFAKRCEKVITIEHDKDWFEKLKAEAKNRNFNNWEGHFIPPELNIQTSDLSSSNPDHYFSEGSQSMTYKSYASYIEKFNNEYFDMVLIDGRVRPSCTKHSIHKVKIGGYLIIDNTEREYYLDAIAGLLQNFELSLHQYSPGPYVPFFTRTSIWKKVK